MISFTVLGTPKPQGSKRAFPTRSGRVALVEDSRTSRDWRADVIAEALRHRPPAPLEGPVDVGLVFTMPKPKSAPKRKPSWPTTKPDVDKLARNALDALQIAGILRDDAQVVSLIVWKGYEGWEGFGAPSPGVRVFVTPTRSGSFMRFALATRGEVEALPVEADDVGVRFAAPVGERERGGVR